VKSTNVFFSCQEAKACVPGGFISTYSFPQSSTSENRSGPALEEIHPAAFGSNAAPWSAPTGPAGSIFEILYRPLVPRLGHNKTIGAIVHRLCQLIWIMLHNGVRYEERGTAVGEKSTEARAA
jgi:hypothetical protein